MTTTKWGSGGGRTYDQCQKTVTSLRASGMLPDGSLYPTVQEGSRVLPDFTPRVLLGMDLMDMVLPGWQTELDLTHLDLESDQSCVLGQTWPLYARATGALETLPDPDSTEYTRFADAVLNLTEDQTRYAVSAEYGFSLSMADLDLVNIYALEEALGDYTRAGDIGTDKFVPMFWERLTRTWLTQIAEAHRTGRWTSTTTEAVPALT